MLLDYIINENTVGKKDNLKFLMIILTNHLLFT